MPVNLQRVSVTISFPSVYLFRFGESISVSGLAVSGLKTSVGDANKEKLMKRAARSVKNCPIVIGF